MSSQMNQSGIVNFRIVDHIGILTIDNGKQNKIDQADFVDLDVLKQWVSTEPILGLIITGKGRHFSSGANVDNIASNIEDLTPLRNDLKRGREILNYIESLPMITVAAISGICFGAGLEIALSCQFRIASESAVLGFPESNLGIMPGLSGTVRLPKLIGKSRAIEMIVSGQSVAVDEAYTLGLIDQVTPKKEQLTAAIQFIKGLTENKSVEQVESIVVSVNRSFTLDRSIAMEKECELFLTLVGKSLKSEVV